MREDTQNAGWGGLEALLLLIAVCHLWSIAHSLAEIREALKKASWVEVAP